VEADERVQGAIVDAIKNFLRTGTPRWVLDEGLRVAIERSQNLTESVTKEWRKRILQQQKKTLAKYKIPDVDLDTMEDKLPAKALQSLSNDQYLSLLDAEHGPFEMLDREKELPLDGLAQAIDWLVWGGASSKSFSRIFCKDCDFRTASLDGASFDFAYLVGARFDKMSLRKASFREAEIGDANFFAADLTGADLSMDLLLDRNREFTERHWTFPNLECAKLSGANLSGRPLVLFSTRLEMGRAPQFEIQLPRMTSVQVDGSTKLDNFSIVTATTTSDAYFKAHRKTRPEWVFNYQLGSSYTENPLVVDQVELHAVPRHIRDGGYTTATINWGFKTDNLKGLKPDAFRLRSFIDQPALRGLPLYSQFIDAVDARRPRRKIGASAKPQSRSEVGAA
jgi:hypothetical protein